MIYTPEQEKVELTESFLDMVIYSTVILITFAIIAFSSPKGRKVVGKLIGHTEVVVSKNHDINSTSNTSIIAKYP